MIIAKAVAAKWVASLILWTLERYIAKITIQAVKSKPLKFDRTIATLCAKNLFSFIFLFVNFVLLYFFIKIIEIYYFNFYNKFFY